MFQNLGRLIALAMLIAGLGYARPAAADVSVPHKEHCKGTLTDVLPGKLSYQGKGNATHFGKYSIKGSSEFDDQGHVLNGEFTTTIADGSTISGTYSGTYELHDDGSATFLVDVLWLTGTGRLEGVTGSAKVIATLSSVTPGAPCEYVTQGTLTFPGRR
jgi:hypothetical protein